MKSLCSLFRLTVLLLVITPVISAFPADPLEPTKRSPGSVTPEVLSAKIAEVEAATELDDETKAKLAEVYRKAIRQLETASSYNAAADAFARARATAPEQASTIRQELAVAEQAARPVTLGVSEEAGLAEIEQVLLREKANLAAVEAKLADLEKQLATEADRPTAARQRLTEAQQRQEELSAERKAPGDELPALAEARRWVLETEDLALSAEIQMLDQELLSQAVRVELLKAQRNRTTRSVKRIGERVRRLEETLNRRRTAEAERAQAEAEAAQREAVGKHPLKQQVAEQNAALSEELRSAAADLERVTAEEDEVSKAGKRIEEAFRSVRQKLEVAGLSQALGRVLFEQRRDLPDPRLFRKQARARVRLIAAAGLRQIRHEEERRRLRDLDAELARRTAKVDAHESARIRGELRTLLKSRRELLDQAIATSEAYLAALGELDFAQRRLLDTAETYGEFLAERLLWVRTSPPVSWSTLRKLPEEAARFLSPAGWLEVLKGLGYRATHSPIPALVFALLGILLWKARQVENALQNTGKQVGRVATDRLAFSFQALGWTLLLAAPWPLLAATLGWQLRLALDATEFSKAVGMALLMASEDLFFLQVFRLLCVPNGLAAAHFGWSPSSTERLRREFGRLLVTFLPAAFVFHVALYLDYGAMGGKLGRFAFVWAMLALAAFNYGVLHPERGVVQGILLRRPTSLFARLRRFWFPLGVAVPLLFVGVALAGYVFAAGTLVGQLVRTFWLTLGLSVVQQFAVRWLLLVHRRLAYRAAIERREAARAAAEAEEAAPPGGEGGLDEVEEPQVDLAALSQYSRKLLNTAVGIAGVVGLWFLWSEVLPALGILEGISLWTRTAIVAGEATRVPVTLADVGLTALIAVVTVAAARNLPALLEILLLQRLRVSSGGRYAVTTLSRYLVTGIGTLLATNALGFHWSQIQWLVAALGVGIGFGLQEIVANFISGLIILFERPIRIGDVITVGDTDGVVTRIRIRATTIRNWDKKELLVPNKEFITGRLLNWSLSDQMIRVLVPVGIAYGSDVQQAMSIMAETAEQHERVLEEPKPFVTFDGFGDNALMLTLRCYVGTVDDRVITISELHQAINGKFNETGVVIAFPQRDLHLDARQPLDVRIRHDDANAATGEKSRKED